MENTAPPEERPAAGQDAAAAPEWEGKSLAALREKEAALATAYEEMRVFRESIRAQQEEIESRIDSADKAVRVEIGKLIDEDPSALVRGGWECPVSPTGYCIYNEVEDVTHDFCLICGDPSERK